MPESYENIVERTFITDAIRSALLVDDEFPRFDQLIELGGSIDQQYDAAEVNRAAGVYKMFREKHVICDVENSLEHIEGVGIANRIRKSDFVLLDYHLVKGDLDASHATKLLCDLANSEHFNTVVLYTRHDSLYDAWLKIATNLRGNWQVDKEILEEENLDLWERLIDEDLLPDLEEVLLEECLLDKKRWATTSKAAKRLRADFEALGVAKSEVSHFIIALVHRHASTLLVDDDPSKNDISAEASVLKGSGRGKSIWMQTGNLFLAIVKKSMPIDGEYKPDEIFDQLNEALIEWEPNLIRILLSEIQNKLELDGLAASERYTGSEVRQSGIGFQLLSSLPTDSDFSKCVDLDEPLGALVSRISDAIRSRLLEDGELSAVAKAALRKAIDQIAWDGLPNGRKERVQPLLGLTNITLGLETNLRAEDVFSDLNHFLSTQEVNKISLTSGSVFMDPDNTDDCWVCCSPACDMAPRAVSETIQPWMFSIECCKSMIAVKLSVVNSISSALNTAEQGETVFIRRDNGSIKAFRAADEGTSQPAIENMMVHNYGRCTQHDGNKILVTIQRLIASADKSSVILTEPRSFQVVCQLRPEYAARLLQKTGNHLSRIGVDFLDLPSK